MSSIQKKSTLLICICRVANTTKPMKSSVFQQYHKANIFLLAPLPSLRSWSCQLCLTPVCSWKGKEERTPQNTGAPAQRKGKWFSTSKRCLTPKEEAEAESRTMQFRLQWNNICFPRLTHRQHHLTIKTDTIQRHSGLLNFEKALEKHVDSRIIFYSSSVCSLTKPNRKKKAFWDISWLLQTQVFATSTACPGQSVTSCKRPRICLFLMPPNPIFNAPTRKSLFSGNPATLLH